ncbi:MAG: HAD-IA family hydrolase [Chitinivibrionales bacterium]|nr:HAD-IA family hydrolase [Chitinivibrionales bacterium]MBD3356817.1 HAD-IA family hydrolase [Chitinivibrionales bacterium]
MKSYEYYLFDADGTLIDTTELIYQCFSNTLKTYAKRRIDRQEVIRNIGLPLRRQLECYLGTLSEDEAKRISSYHMEYQLGIYTNFLKPFPGIIDALRNLKSAGKRLAVVTSRMPDSLELYLRHTRLLEFFDALVTPASTSKHKPNPEPALKALELLEGAPEKALMVGDATFDIECGARAGADTAFVAWSHHPLASLTVSPTYILHSPSELHKKIKNAEKE